MATLIAILISLLSSMVGMELYAWKDKFCDWLINRSVERVLPEHQDRVREEWCTQLSEFPNSLVKICHALHIFLGSATSKINRDLLQLKFDKIDHSLNTLLDLHQTDYAKLHYAKEEQARSSERRAQLQQFIRESADKFRTPDWPNGKPKEEHERLFLRCADSFENFGNNLVGATARVATITGMSLESVCEALSAIDIQLKNALQKIARAKELLPSRDFEETSNLLKQLECDCAAINAKREEDVPIDENTEAERIRILAAVENAVNNLLHSKQG